MDGVRSEVGVPLVGWDVLYTGSQIAQLTHGFHSRPMSTTTCLLPSIQRTPTNEQVSNNSAVLG